MTEIMKLIKKDKQIKKFSAYGFLKNLRFFEPYLILFLMGKGLSLFEIGITFSMREFIMYVFEIPSGIIADYYGRKNELYLCFGFYIISFILFFFTSSMGIALLAMAFFGLGEAFRSGTHKAMIYTYLEEQDWQKHKALVYGRTRSFSLLGSSMSALLAIVLILTIPSPEYIFLASIVPYMLDLFLIMSYPSSLNGERKESNKSFMGLMKSHLLEILKQKDLRHILLSSSSFDAVFKSVKDYIQPILEVLILSSGFVLFSRVTADETLKIVLGISYGLIYILSAFASRNAYKLKKYGTSGKIMNFMYILFAFSFFVLFIFIKIKFTLGIIVLFLILYLLKDSRKPIFVDVCDDHMEKHQRATVMSIESQMKAMFSIIIAPLVGLVADQFGVSYVMLALCAILFGLYNFTKVK